MASLKLRNLLLICFAFYSQSILAKPSTLMPEVPNDEAIQAYRSYWNSFDIYEEQVMNSGSIKYKNAWSALKEERRKLGERLREEQIAQLKESANKYRLHLSNYSNAYNIPYVMHNLARVLNQLGDIYASTEPENSTIHKREALEILVKLQNDFPDFNEKEQAIYLKALIYESLGRKKLALATWKKLADSAKETIYGLYGIIAIGDHYFKDEEAAIALQYYKKAATLLEKLKPERFEYEKLRVLYRIAWSSYRSADLQTTIQTGISLLNPGQDHILISQHHKITNDAIELMADSLYENNNLDFTKSVLKSRGLMQHAASISLRVMRNYLSVKIYPDTIELGEFTIAQFPLAKELPDILFILSSAYDNTKDTNNMIKALERLSLLLPNQSLWRSRHKEKFSIISKMETLAKDATKRIATFYYQHGMETGSRSAFISALAYYKLLIEFNPNASDSNEWRLKQAHCNYFAGYLDKAESQYKGLKTDYKLKLSTLKVTAYQLVLTLEKKWRQSFAKAAKKSKNPLKSPIVVQNLRNLEKSIEEYIDRFPPSMISKSNIHNRSVDLLLVGAAANRDHEDFNSASKFWHRVLISNPTPGQKSMAIRGLMLSKVRAGTHKEVIELASRFLKLEDWDRLGSSLGNELRGMLKIALKKESDRLNNEGKIREAGILLTSTAESFPNLPDRDSFYRDGAYMLAIAGDWENALKYSNSYLKSGKGKKHADLLYLKARALEYQILFHAASLTYLELGTKYRKHSRAFTSLKRAERLAIAENDFETAAKAASLQVRHLKKYQSKMDAYSRAYNHYKKTDNHEKAIAIAKRRLRVSRNIKDRLESELMVSNSNYALGYQVQALNSYKSIANRCKKNKRKLEKPDYGAIYGESNHHLGVEAFNKFRDFTILEREGSLQENINLKMKYFRELVNYFDLSVKAAHSEWSPASNYKIGEASELFANELHAIPLKTDKKLSVYEKDSLAEKTRRLKKLAETSFSKNLIYRRKNPNLFKNNIWVKRSTIKLSGYLNINSDLPEYEEELPNAIGQNIPSQWSL